MINIIFNYIFGLSKVNFQSNFYWQKKKKKKKTQKKQKQKKQDENLWNHSNYNGWYLQGLNKILIRNV